MKKLYVSKENLNEEELKTGKVSYKRIIDRFVGNTVLCNNIDNLDTTIWDNIRTNNAYEEMNFDIYQYLLCNINSFDLEKLEELGNPLILSYSEMLECDVLMVDHCGTSWDYIMTNVEWSENLEEC